MKQPGRHFTHESRDLERTQVVYGGSNLTNEQRRLIGKMESPPERDFNVYWGEVHGHTSLSDGQGSLDDYFTAARDEAKLDFCAVTDHDHGGVGRAELWGEKWELTQQKVAEYHQPGTFVTLLGYERDSWPYYANLCLYYREGRGDLVRGVQEGEITRVELEALLARDDILALPHHTATLSQGANFDALPLELMTPLMEVYSKWGASEYFGNPEPVTQEARGGHWQVALERGARMGCLGGSDVHSPHPGLVHHSGGNLRYDNPGLVAVLAPELSRQAIFEALKTRRCYAASGARILIDFRLDGAVMGEEITLPEEAGRRLWVRVVGEGSLGQVELLKNSQPYVCQHLDGSAEQVLFTLTDWQAERKTDYYYVRVTQADGRRAWSSPIWVTSS